MIHLITSREDQYDAKLLSDNDIVISSAADFKKFIDAQKIIQLDTETNVVKKLFDRELYAVQIGNYSGEEQWVFDITGLSGLKLRYLKECLDNRELEKLIHNAMFEYSIIQKTWSIDIDKIRDTMLMSKVLKTGITMPKGFHGLAGCIKRYFNIDVDKAAQTTFSSEPMTLEQILYAATDVVFMGKLQKELANGITTWEMANTVVLENAYVRAASDALWNNLYLDTAKWTELMKIKEGEIAESEAKLFEVLETEFAEQAQELGFIQRQDTYLFSWGSPTMKRNFMRLAYPMLPNNCTTLPAYKKFKDSLGLFDEDIDPTVINLYLARNFEALELYFIQNHHQYLVDNNLFIPKGRININFNSPPQTLKLFQLIKPDLLNVNKKTIPKINHPLAFAYKKYKNVTKLHQSYGQNFLDACDPDGMLRVQNINQIVNTGRISMSLFQLLPQKGGYRECFYAEDGWTICGIDYNSQELVVAGTISGEPVIMEALANGWDMHSICASLMFPVEWAECGEDPVPKGKPKSKKGDELRGFSKKTSFGIMYGKSSIGLAEDLDLYANLDELIEEFSDDLNNLILENSVEYSEFCTSNSNGKDTKKSRKEFLRLKRSLGLFHPEEITGDDLVQRFKGALPILNSFLSNGAESAVSRLYSRTKDVFGRIRYFEKPENPKEEKSIFREAMNFPIQGSSANMTKYACVLMKKYIEKNNLGDKVKMLFAVHDEILTKVKIEFSEEWYKIKMGLMEEAGRMILDNDLQKAEGGNQLRWTKG